MAIGHKILIAAYHLLATHAPYRDLGATYLGLGYEVTLGPKAA